MKAWDWYESVIHLSDMNFPTSVPDFLATPAICVCGKIIVKLFLGLDYWYELENIHAGCGVENTTHIPNESDTLFFRLDLGTPP